MLFVGQVKRSQLRRLDSVKLLALFLASLVKGRWIGKAKTEGFRFTSHKTLFPFALY